MAGGHRDSAQCAWGLCWLGQAGLRTPFLLFVFHWVVCWTSGLEVWGLECETVLLCNLPSPCFLSPQGNWSWRELSWLEMICI